MSLPKDDQTQRALKREWMAARIVVVGGLIVAVGTVGYFAWRARQERLAQQPVVHTTVVARPKVDAKVLAQVELAVCTAELSRAKDLGMVPQYGDLASPRLMRGTMPRRFVCEAQTHLTHYFISADLVCNQLADSRCVSVYRIALKDGTLIYSRPQ